MKRINNIWIDICHTPQAVFYIPIILELKKRGYSILITVQESEESYQLLKNAGFTFFQIGKKYGRHKIKKCIGLITRSLKLFQSIHSQNIRLGVSQGSPYQILVCQILGIPTVAIGDNEKTDWFFTKFAKKNLFPQAIPDRFIKVPLKKVIKFPGLKEEVYLSDFKLNPHFLAELNLNPQKNIVTIRSPATQAQYHNTKTDVLYQKILMHLLTLPNIQIVLLPRTRKEIQQLHIEFGEFAKRFFIPPQVIDGLNLIWHSDAVFSGGGTMVREAALMGVPAYSYFQGEMLAVDRFLFQKGKLKFIRSEKDIVEISVQKRSKKLYIKKNNGLRKWIVDEILL